MKTLKISLFAVFGLALVIYGYLYAVNHGYERYNLPGTGVKLKIENPIAKDLTFGVVLNILPTTKIKNGLTTYIVYDENSIEAAEKQILDWFYDSMKNNGGESLAKMRAEIKLIEDVNAKIIAAELLTIDGTPEQKLLVKQNEILAGLHGGLAQGSNMNLQYGFK
jgi:hypothetical protein